MTNKFAGKCAKCAKWVPASAGICVKTNGKFGVQHNSCPADIATVPFAPTHPPTAEQATCVALFDTGEDLVIQAGAGAGKTTTLLLMALSAKAKGRRGQYCAYNAAIVSDISTKCPDNLTASTMHKLAMAAVGRQLNARQRLQSSRQSADEVARLLTLSPYRVPGTDNVLPPAFLGSLVMKAVRKYCNSADATVTAAHFGTVEGLDADGEYAQNNRLAATLLPVAERAWADLTDPNGRLRFNHDVYLKYWSLSSPRIVADFVMLDEAQDADPVQVQIIEHQRTYGTQVVVVGDEQQVLYEWRGAVDALKRFEQMGANVAFLSQSFRFGDAVAEVANGLLDRLNARLRVQGFDPVSSVVAPLSTPACVLTRTNAGAVRTVLAEIARGRKPFLVGGAATIVSFCEAARDLQAGRRTNHPELACFDSWIAVEQYADGEDGNDLKLMVKLITEFTAQVIISALNRQGDEADADVTVSTAHKSKGREWATVQIAGDFPVPKDGEVMCPADLRLAYVACTRAKTQLDLSAVPHFLPGWVPTPAVV